MKYLRRLFAFLLAFLLLGSLSAVRARAADFEGGQPSGLCLTPDGAMLVTDVYNKVIWLARGDGAEIWAGKIPVADLSGEPQGLLHDGSALSAFFTEPWAIVPWGEGYAVSDTRANVIRYLADGEVRTLCGSGKAGKADGKPREASFDLPTGLAVGADGTLYVADTGNGSIRSVDASGAVSTLCTGLSGPTGLFWAGEALYVAETDRCRVLRVDAAGTYEAVAGASVPAETAGEYYGGFADGPAASAMFDHPQGLAVAPDGTVYVADTGNHALRVIRDGRVSTLVRGGTDAAPGMVKPRGLLLQGDTLYVADCFSATLSGWSVVPRSFEKDVAPSAWYAPAVAEAVRRGLTDGTGEGSFSPEGEVTRAMLVTMLSRLRLCADGTAVIDGDRSFSDVPEDAWYASAVRWAADGDLTRGVDGETFLPDGRVTREQLVTMLYRFARMQGYDLSAGSAAQLAAFADGQSVSDWAREAVTWAVAAGVLSGSEGKLWPQAPATRAQTAQLFIRFMDACGM